MAHSTDELESIATVATRRRDSLSSLRKERGDLASVVNNAVETIRPLIDEAAHDLTVSSARYFDSGMSVTLTNRSVLR
jgi:hypothetical protein